MYYIPTSWVRAKRSKEPKYGQNLCIVLGTCARKGDNLVSPVEYGFWSSVGTLEDCVGIWSDVLLFQISG